MPLEEEIKKARLNIVADGYDMSLGELMSLYKQGELIINPAFQRYFRWDTTQKARFIESILLGIPIPPVFVFQRDDGVWELVDGLQRLSTVFEFAEVLRTPEGDMHPPSTMEGTTYLPSLAGKTWSRAEGASEEDAISTSHQIEIKRARIRVEILKKGSDAFTKFELFQRLNTGGSSLSEQEVRNCVMVMIDETFYAWITDLARVDSFDRTATQTDVAERRQKHVELVLRFITFRNVPYDGKLDVHEFLDDATIRLASDAGFDRPREEDVFRRTFAALDEALGPDAFKRFDGGRFLGQFLISAFEFISVGVSHHIDAIDALRDERATFLRDRIREVWQDEVYRRNTGAGVRGTTRVSTLIPHGIEFFRP